MRNTLIYLAAVTSCTLAGGAHTPSAKDIHGPTPLLAIENEPPPRLIGIHPFPSRPPWAASSFSLTNGGRSTTRTLPRSASPLCAQSRSSPTTVTRGSTSRSSFFSAPLRRSTSEVVDAQGAPSGWVCRCWTVDSSGFGRYSCAAQPIAPADGPHARARTPNRSAVRLRRPYPRSLRTIIARAGHRRPARR